MLVFLPSKPHLSVQSSAASPFLTRVKKSGKDRFSRTWKHILRMVVVKVELRPSSHTLTSRFFRLSEAIVFDTFLHWWEHIVTNVLSEEQSRDCGAFQKA
jgi:hypothetical protein